MAEHLQDLANDLLRLEINTVIKEEFTLEKIRSMRFMLYEIAQEYRIKLMEIFGNHFEESETTQRKFDIEYGGQKSFEEILNVARFLGEKIKENYLKVKDEDFRTSSKEEITMLSRIIKQSEIIYDIFSELKSHTSEESSENDWNNDFPPTVFDNMPDLVLNAFQIAVVRKAKEIGTQRILMQTIVQLEGDITTYVTPRFLMMREKEQNMLLHVHNTSMSTSIKVWQYLFNTIGNLAGSAFSKVTKKKK